MENPEKSGSLHYRRKLSCKKKLESEAKLTIFKIMQCQLKNKKRVLENQLTEI